MAQHRTLIEGMKAAPAHAAVDPAKEREIVFGPKAVTTRPSPKVHTAGLNTRVRAEVFAALKRASLQRQLDQVEPNTIAELVQEALEHWLRSNGYID